MQLPIAPGFNWDFSLELGQETDRLMTATWPNYICEPSDIPDPGLTCEMEAEELTRRNPLWGIRRDSDQALVAYAHAVLVDLDFRRSSLPNHGWRFAIETVTNPKLKANCLCVIAINVDPNLRRQGFSQALLERAKLVAKERGFAGLVGPVRPTLKHEFPQLSMQEYLEKRTDRGEIFDPWLRAHTKAGADVLNICEQSVTITATLDKWRNWTGADLQNSGKYILPQGLAPLVADVEKNIGVYCEPNIWVRYLLD